MPRSSAIAYVLAALLGATVTAWGVGPAWAQPRGSETLPPGVQTPPAGLPTATPVPAADASAATSTGDADGVPSGRVSAVRVEPELPGEDPWSLVGLRPGA